MNNPYVIKVLTLTEPSRPFIRVGEDIYCYHNISKHLDRKVFIGFTCAMTLLHGFTEAELKKINPDVHDLLRRAMITLDGKFVELPAQPIP